MYSGDGLTPDLLGHSLDLESSGLLGEEGSDPMLKAVMEKLEGMQEEISRTVLPLRKSIAECSIRCFSSFNEWSLSKRDADSVGMCLERCEEQVGEVEKVVEQETEKIAENMVHCVERCQVSFSTDSQQEACASRCVEDGFSASEIEKVLKVAREEVQKQRFGM